MSAAPLIKICGITSSAALDAAHQAGVEYVGLVFFDRSPRHVDLAQAVALAARNHERSRLVGLFVDAKLATIIETARAVGLDAVQLHGRETPAEAAMVRAQLGIDVWKAMSVTSAADVSAAARFVGTIDRVLFDAKAPTGADIPGGNGLVFDWSLLAAWRAPLAWGLAGGLNPDNVRDAAARTGAPLVDVSSGVETAPGVKDLSRIAAFVRAARGQGTSGIG